MGCNYYFRRKGAHGLATIMTLGVMIGASLTNANAQIAPVINCQNRPVTALTFSAPSLESGTDLQIGAIYRFSNVATGVDALIEITGFANGGALAFIDRDTGLVNYFQPELVTTGTSSADFNISFVETGLSTPIALDIAVSSIDVDGNNAQLREYVEYEDSSVGFVLNAGTELDRNASGPTPGRNRYEARTTVVAPGIDPTAEDNIATVFYTDVTSFDFRVGTLGNGNQTRLTSQGYDCPNLTTPAPVAETIEDFGDALINNYGNPIHTIVSGVQLGINNTTDTAPGNSASANTDLGDDGAAFPSLTPGTTETIDVNVAGAGGYLQGWIDWNGDGDILDTGEQIALNSQDSDGDGLISLNIPVPLTATPGLTIARIRWSTMIDVDYQEAAIDGEVEDYQITVNTPPVTQLICPIGTTAIPGNGNAGTVIVNAQNGPLALGALSAAGSAANSVSARVRNTTPTLVLQLEDIVPENAEITVSIARDNNNGNVDIEGSLDGTNFFPMTTFNGGTTDTLSHLTLTATTGGMEFIRVQRNSGATWIDGVEYNETCQAAAVIEGQKDVEIFDPTGSGNVYALPGNDVIYSITITNTGGGSADPDSVFIVDSLPPDIEFWNGDIDSGGPDTYIGAEPVGFEQSSGTGLSFNYNTDIRFATGTTAPTDFNACNPITPDNTYRQDLKFICINPKGSFFAGDPDPFFSVSFRARIK